jgi:hypothetical protein
MLIFQVVEDSIGFVNFIRALKPNGIQTGIKSLKLANAFFRIINNRVAP